MRCEPATPLLGLLSVILLLGATASAEEEKAADPSCREEVEKLCPDMEPASPERARCVREGAAKLSEGCRRLAMRRRNTRTAGIEALRGACGREIDDHCDQVRRGSGRLLRCLGALDDEKRSATCQEYLEVLAHARERRRAGAKPE